ncbi:uncharacterized protein [Paramisgurnus dabryanus]|uniref:uncharacterized protein n=1 Tax=Paramisgurnus dabryanus TaxID=90735 RepID=UPI0031F37042
MDSYVRGKLSEWQLDNLIDNFKEQEVDEESFLLLDDNAVASLIPKIGQRVKFQKHHKELFASPINPPIESNSSVESMEMTPAPTDPVTMTVELFPAFAVRQILEGTTEGKSVLSSLDSVQAITTKQRRLLVRLLVSHLLETNGETPSSETKKTLAMALVYEFPCLKDNTGSSYGAWYTPGRKHRPATGFLEERLRNIRKRIRKLNPSSRLEPQQDQSATTTENAVPPEKFQEMVDWLKMHKYPISEVESYMKETAVYRGRWIRNNGSKTISEIVKEFPRLVDNPGMVRMFSIIPLLKTFEMVTLQVGEKVKCVFMQCCPCNCTLKKII